jgi:ABC-type bacteriocin/lantibiotic exporter with double-glycine peptidase domain
MKRNRTHAVLQMEVAECGAAVLAIMLEYYGSNVNLEKIREQLGCSSNGTSAFELVELAKQYKLQAYGACLTLDELRIYDHPIIVFWEFNHFLVVEYFNDDTVFVNDPAYGRMRIPLEEFSKRYTGVAVVCIPSDNFQKTERKKRFSYIANVKTLFCSNFEVIKLAAFLSCIASLSYIFFSLCSKIFFDSINCCGFSEIAIIMIYMMIGISFINIVVFYYEQKIFLDLNIANSFNNSIRLLKKFLKLPLSFFERRKIGDLSMRLSLINIIFESILKCYISSLYSLSSVLFIIAGIAVICWKIALVSIGLIAIYALVLYKFNRDISDHGANSSREKSRVFSEIYNILQGLISIKAMGYEDVVLKRFCNTHLDYISSNTALAELLVKFSTMLSITTIIVETLFLFVCVYYVYVNLLSVGGFIAIEALYSILKNSISEIVVDFGWLQQNNGHLIRFYDVMKYKNEKKIHSAKNIQISNTAILLKKVCFSYSALESETLKNISFRCKKGQNVVIVGKTGVGKSTLIKLLCGLYKQKKGKIIVNGRVGIVEQFCTVFSGNVKENVCFGKNYPDEVVGNAIKMACLDDVLNADTVIVEDGRILCSGEKQRIEFARIFLINPDIYILDEATSALDFETERKILQNLNGKSVIMVTHRPTIMEIADWVIFMENGKIRAQGHHKDLLQNNISYSQFFIGTP